MRPDEWIEAFETLEEELGREPTEDEVREYLSKRSETLYDPEDFDDYVDDIEDPWSGTTEED